MAYSDKVLDHYNNPRNVGSLTADRTVGTGIVGALEWRRYEITNSSGLSSSMSKLQ